MDIFIATKQNTDTQYSIRFDESTKKLKSFTYADKIDLYHSFLPQEEWSDLDYFYCKTINSIYEALSNPNQTNQYWTLGEEREMPVLQQKTKKRAPEEQASPSPKRPRTDENQLENTRA